MTRCKLFGLEQEQATGALWFVKNLSEIRNSACVFRLFETPIGHY
jgi:hypothetical protein